MKHKHNKHLQKNATKPVGDKSYNILNTRQSKETSSNDASSFFHNHKKGLRILAALTFVVVAVLFGIQYSSATKEKAQLDMLARNNLTNMSIQEMVLALDSTIEESKSLMSGITSEKLTIYEQDKEYTFDVPEDLFYLSFAPYINTTHPCANHNLTTCRSELVNQDFVVTIIDSNGNEIINTKLTSMDNGFIGVWLPSNIEATLHVQFGKLTAQYDISTFEGDNTCLTEPLRLTNNKA